MKIALVTGANSGVGFATCERLLHEVNDVLVVITCRSEQKARATIARLPLGARVEYVLLDLLDMHSVAAAVRSLRQRYPRIDWFYMNAGFGNFTGVDYLGVLRQLLTDSFISTFTAPKFKLQKSHQKSVDGLGDVFQANVFAHAYMLHELSPNLAGHGKAIWSSSLEAFPWAFKIQDLQSLQGPDSYESSKRLTDLYHFGIRQKYADKGIALYLVHPGLCATDIFASQLLPGFGSLMRLVFYLCRWLGSPWHTIHPYRGAAANLYVVLNDPATKIKWGSGDDRGKPVIRETAVERDPKLENQVAAEMEAMIEEWHQKLQEP